MMMLRSKIAATLTGVLLLTSAAPAFADPPSWAPAHGHRDKDDKKHKHDHKKHKHDDRHHDHDQVVIFREQPVAPAYQSFYGLPLGLESGRCDTGLIDANLGTLLGAVAGGLGGSQFGKGDGKIAATIGGVLLGAALGNTLQRGMTPADQGCLAQTLERAPTGQQIVWNNPDQGARYEVVPTRTYESNGGFCREYSSRVFLGNQLEEVRGTACRQADGAWKIMN